MAKSAYKRVMLKLSGEMLLGREEKGIDFGVVEQIAKIIKEVVADGTQIAIVVGGGNIWRYRDATHSNLPRTGSDQMGMLATIMNGMALREKFKLAEVDTVLYSAIEMSELCEPYSIRSAQESLAAGKVVILSGGTGNPFFTTDTAAALRALELGCDVLLKATNVEGVYDDDPRTKKSAKMYTKVSYSEALEKNLKVMDATAISLCRDSNLPVRVFSILDLQNIKKVVEGDEMGTVMVGE